MGEGFFGNIAPRLGAMRAEFTMPPFSVLDARKGDWIQRKRAWLSLGLQGELGRMPSKDDQTNVAYRRTLTGFGKQLKTNYEKRGAAEKLKADCGIDLEDVEDEFTDNVTGVSVFDPVLTELVYKWFGIVGGTVLDPFAGGSTRGVVAEILGYRYTGVDIRDDQLAANRTQADLLGVSPTYIHGDSTDLGKLVGTEPVYDLAFLCPPYYDREMYSGGAGDGSMHKTYADFVAWYSDVLQQAAAALTNDRFFVIVVGEIRDRKTGIYRNFVGDTIDILRNVIGLHYYNEIIFITRTGSLPIRAGRQFRVARKIGKTHQQILVFWKGNVNNIRGLFENGNTNA